jgi:hypothetical protein
MLHNSQKKYRERTFFDIINSITITMHARYANRVDYAVARLNVVRADAAVNVEIELVAVDCDRL